MSTNGTSSNVGSTATNVGDFTTLLLDINPTYTTTGYPNVWTNFVVTVSGLGGPITGRLAFRYFVENGGPSGANSDYIGIDTVQYDCNGRRHANPDTHATTDTDSNADRQRLGLQYHRNQALSSTARIRPWPSAKCDAQLIGTWRLRQCPTAPATTSFDLCLWRELYRDADQGSP